MKPPIMPLVTCTVSPGSGALLTVSLSVCSHTAPSVEVTRMRPKGVWSVEATVRVKFLTSSVFARSSRTRSSFFGKSEEIEGARRPAPKPKFFFFSTWVSSCFY